MSLLWLNKMSTDLVYFPFFPDLHSYHKQKSSLVSSVHLGNLSSLSFFSLMSLPQFNDSTMLLIWSFLSCSLKGRLSVSTHRETTSKWSSWVCGNQPNASGAPAGARAPLPSPNQSVAFLGGPETAIFLLSFIFSLFKQFWTMFSIHPLTELDQIYSFTRLIWNVSLEYRISNNPSNAEDTGPQVGEGTSFDLKLFHPEEKKKSKGLLNNYFQGP